MQETRIQSLDGEDPLEEEITTHSSILAWEIPWTEEPGGLQSVGSQRVRHDWAHTQGIFEVSYHYYLLIFEFPAWHTPSNLSSFFVSCYISQKFYLWAEGQVTEMWISCWASNAFPFYGGLSLFTVPLRHKTFHLHPRGNTFKRPEEEEECISWRAQGFHWLY